MGIKGTPVLDQLAQPFPPLDPATLAGTASLTLPGRLESVRRARGFAHRTLEGWRLVEQVEPVTLVVSELVTNALRYGACDRPGESHSPPPVELDLMRYSRRLVCAVRDASEAAPRVREPAAAAESGRGLYLVECFSDGWGWRPLAGEQPGKVVWATFRTS